MTITVNLTIECAAVSVDEVRIRTIVERVLADAHIHSAQVGIAILTDAAIRKLNQQYLSHDYATDAISFVLESNKDHLEGEIAVSAETARREAARLGWAAADELLLYIVHGALHLVGEDDTTKADAKVMRRRERELLADFGLVPPWEEHAVKSSSKAMPSRESNRSREELRR